MSEQFGRFELLKEIASGGMAKIHVAKQRGVEGFEKLVVIKKILPNLAKDQQFVKMFLDEARIAARLTHPNVVQIFDLGFTDNDYFIAMEYVHGENLLGVQRACRKQNKPLPLRHALKLISQTCEGLHYAHTKTDVGGQALNIVHCDVSPQNILVSFDGIVKVVDFGIARAATQHEDESLLLKGKLAYMSPEQCLGKPLDARSDIFSLGTVLWELVTGKRLFTRLAKTDVLKAVIGAPVPPPSTVNPQVTMEIDAIVARAMEKKPAARYQSAYDLHTALEKVAYDTGQVSNSYHIGAFVQDLLKEKLESLLRIEEARAAGAGLVDTLFDDVAFEAEETDLGHLDGSPVFDPSLPLFTMPTPEEAQPGRPVPHMLRKSRSGVARPPAVRPPKRLLPFLLVLLLAAAILGFFCRSSILAFLGI